MSNLSRTLTRIAAIAALTLGLFTVSAATIDAAEEKAPTPQLGGQVPPGGVEGPSAPVITPPTGTEPKPPAPPQQPPVIAPPPVIVQPPVCGTPEAGGLQAPRCTPAPDPDVPDGDANLS